MKRKTQPKCIDYGPEWTPDGTRDRLRWVENASRGLRVVGNVHEIKPDCRPLVDHYGWHLDPFGDGETCWGAVLQLPSRAGARQYVPALWTSYDEDDRYTVDFHDVTDNLRDAIYAANRLAELYTEREREYQTIESAKLRAEEYRQEAAELRAQHRRAVGDLRALRVLVAPGNAPTACALLRDRLREMRERVHAALKSAAALDAEPYRIIEGRY